MRILYFTRSDSPHDHRFLKAMVENGNEVFCLRLKALAQPPNTPNGIHEIPWRGVKRRFHIANIPRLHLALSHVIAAVKPDVIHAGPVQDCAFLAALTHFKPLVTMSWGFDMMRDAEESWLQRQLTRATLAQTSLFFADCHAVEKKALNLGYPPGRTLVFPWGVDLDHFSKSMGEQAAREKRRILGWSENFTFVATRSWEPQYGMDLLARAFVSAARQLPSIRLLLLGSGSQERLIRSVLQQPGIAEKVFFAGRILLPDLPAYYCLGDVYISPSRVDGSSVSLLEAMACERPSIVSNIPGNLEWISHGQEGWIFKDGDESGLVDCMIHAARKRDYPGMGIAARQKVSQFADWKANFPRLIDAYHALLKGVYEHH